jgi:pyruvate dehydrogenase E2 component (dihydrolipoamide acetyltransferase)
MAVEIFMPRLTDTMQEGIISYWYYQEGQSIKEGEPFFVVETDKAAVDVEACASGIVLKIFVEEGKSVLVGSRVAVIGEEGEDIKALLASSDSPLEAGQAEKSDTRPEPKRKKINASPAARKKAKAENIDLSLISGTGNAGMITTKDIELYLEQAQEKEPIEMASESEERIVLKGIAKAMAEKMALTVDIPQVTTAAEVDATDLKKLSKQTKTTITSFVVWAVGQGLKNYPIINSSFDEDTVIVKNQFNIGVSVATPHGLVVPNIKNVKRKDIFAISRDLAELANKGRDNQLSIDDISDGTFTITNSGVFGSLFFTPRINPPESAILGMGKIIEQPVVVDGRIAIRAMMYLSLTYDHRVIDGENAVKFLQDVKKSLEAPGQAFAPTE